LGELDEGDQTQQHAEECRSLQEANCRQQGGRNPYKSGAALREGVDVKNAWEKHHCDAHDVNTPCRGLEISRSAYYRWLTAVPSETECRGERIGAETKRVFEERHGSVGYRKVQEQLAAEGAPCCPETGRKTLTRQGLPPTVAARFASTTTDSDQDLPVTANLLDHDFTAARPNEKWELDITYVRTDEGRLYLAVVIDLFSRKVVCWAMAEHMRVGLVLEAFEMTITHRRQTGELLFDSDRDGLRTAGLWDNNPAERFLGQLKAEWVYRHHYRSSDDAKRSLYFYIEMFHNSKRRHAALVTSAPTSSRPNTRPRRHEPDRPVSIIDRPPQSPENVSPQAVLHNSLVTRLGTV
jgi:transposase InsO family protein